jgi:glutamate/tyrosine decarboxylase-like PLP-dependent enzyme
VSLSLPPSTFERLAARVSAIAADYLAGLPTARAFPETSGQTTLSLFDAPLPEEGLGEGALDALADVLAHTRPPGPRFFGYVLGSGEPVAALGELVAGVANQNVTSWRSAPSGVVIERAVIRWLAEAIGCPGFQGSLTGGASSANLMGLAMAREARAQANERGVLPGGALYASEEVHMSIPKAAALLGMGRQALRRIPVDDRFRMDPRALERAIEADEAAGIKPVAVIATAGTVSTGSVDPLGEIAAIARAHKTWLHIDGAYGALAAIAAPALLDGLSLADSIALDAHKWLYQPVDCGCLLFRDALAARATFASTDDYAATLSEDPVEGFAFFEESIEMSRRFRALKLWLSLRYHGLGAFRDAIRANMELAQRLAAAIAAEPRLELLAPVALSAVCFRFVGEAGARPDGADDGALDRLNLAILQRMKDRGRVYLSNARVRGRFALRACIVNHRATAEDVDAIVSETRISAAEIGGGPAGLSA